VDSAVTIIADRVRERVRREGVDLGSDRSLADGYVREEIRRYSERALGGSLPLLQDERRAEREVVASITGFGPLQPFFDDDTVEEIWINGPRDVFVARDGVAEPAGIELTASEVRDLVERMLQSTGRRVDLSSPFVDASLPDGSRLHVVIPDVTQRHWAVNIRKFAKRIKELQQLVALGSLSREGSEFLRMCVLSGQNILVSGATQSGKTTLLGALLTAARPGERIVTVEETFELSFTARDAVAMQCRQPSLEGTGEIKLRLLKEALRMRPSPIVVGEVRQEESLDLLIALNSGVPGMCTVHANSAREAVTKMCTLPLLAGENVSSRFVVPTVAAAVDLVIHVALERDGVRRVREIVAVPGRAEGDVIEIADLFVTRQGQLRRADGFPPHREAFERAGYDVAALLAQGAP
jgi:pilus assembly protein CpaF